MVANQRFVIKFLVVEKCKPCEINKRVWDVYREACFGKKKMFTNGLNIDLPLQVWVKKKKKSQSGNTLSFW